MPEAHGQPDERLAPSPPGGGLGWGQPTSLPPPGGGRSESSGRLADHIAGFGRALRRAGVRTDSARIALALQAAGLVGPERRDDLGAALEAVMIGREQDRDVFRELFDAWFRDPGIALQLPDPMQPAAPAAADAARPRPRVRDALAEPRPAAPRAPAAEDDEPAHDAAMTASALERLRHADFQGLAAAEYRLVERLARDVALPVPRVAARRTHPGQRGQRLHWARTLRQAARTGGELMELRRMQRRQEPLPLLLLVDVSGSMERYARLLLAFLHAATRSHRRRDVFAFGTHLTDLSSDFRSSDTDAMLAAVGAAISDYGGGTRLGASLASLRENYAGRLVGRRTVVLVISDGLDTGEPDLLAHELAWLKRRCRNLLWLNPLLRFEGYAPLARGAAVLHRFADRMLAVHNLNRLEELAAHLAAVIEAP